MPRGLPWSNYQTAQGERPLFYVKLKAKHAAWNFGTYDWLPGPIQGRLLGWDDLFFQLRGGQDNLSLKLVNSPLASALGKGVRCRGANDGVNYDGNGLYVRTSGAWARPDLDHAVQIIFRAWSLSTLTAAGSLVAFRLNHYRFVLNNAGTITLQVWSGGSWQTAVTDTAGVNEGELCSVGFSYEAGTQKWTYFRRSDTGDYTAQSNALLSDATATTQYPYINGDGAGSGILYAGTEGRYCTWLDVDEFRWWTTIRTQAQFNAAARRTLLPTEAFLATLIVWDTLDHGSFADEVNDDPKASPMTAVATGYFENTSGLLTNPANPVYVSGLTRDRISDHIQGDYPIEGATVEVYVTFTDPITKAPQLLFRGRVKEVVAVGRDILELDVVDISEGVHKTIGTLVDATTYPYAPPESIGKAIPEIFGSVTDLEAVPAAVSVQTRLAASALSADTTLTVGSTAKFPATGTLRIDEEEITYTGLGAGGTTFTGCTRGANSTTANSHVTGATVEWVTGETYLFANHGVSAITNVRAVNSKGELVPVSGGTVVLSAPAKVTFAKQPRVTVAGDGSTWLSIEMESAHASNTAQNPLRAAGLSAEFTEVNYALLTQGNPKLSIERNSNFPGPQNSSGVIKAYAVFEHHHLDGISAGATVAAKLEQGGAAYVSLGNLSVQFSTPAGALQQGAFFTESAGFEAQHQHTIPGALHEHDVGLEELSEIIRPTGSPSGWTVENIAPLNAPTGTAAATFTGTSFYNALPGATRLAVDGDADTNYGLTVQIPTLTYFPFPFGNLRGTNRQIKKLRIVAVISGPPGPVNTTTIVLSVRGNIVAQVLPANILPSQPTISARNTVVSSIVDVTSLNILLADLLSPNSWIGVRNNGGLPVGFMNIWELYLEAALDRDADSSIEIRPAYDDWLKPLPNLRDGNPETFEPNAFIANEVVVTGGGLTTAAGYINPQPPVNGPDLPFNNQFRASLKCFFTELQNPQARLRSAIIKIAHTNVIAGSPTLFQNVTVVGGPVFAGPPAVTPPNWVAQAFGQLGPRYQVRLVIKGQIINSFTYFLDRTTDNPPVTYGQQIMALTPPEGVWTNPFGSALTGFINGIVPVPWGGGARVESTSGWQNLLGLAVAGTDFVVGDLIHPQSYIEIVMPTPTAVDLVVDPGAYRPFAPLTAVNAQLDAGYANYHKRCQKFFDIALEVVAENQEIAIPTSVGDTDTAQPLAHSSLTWFDITATWLLVGGWNAMQGVEMVASATAFGGSDFVRLLHTHFIVEFGTVAYENTRRIVADVDQGGGGNPIDHVDRVITTYIGDAALKDTAAFATAKALVRSDAAGVVREPISTKDLIEKILRQYRCSGHWEAGKFVPLFMPSLSSLAAGSPTLTVDDVIRNGISIRRTPLDEIRNRALVNYGPNYVFGGWKDSIIRTKASSITAYGVTHTEIVDADWITTLASAQDYGDSILDYRGHVSFMVEIETYLNGLNIVRGDVITLTHEFYSGTKLEVLEMAIKPPARIKLVTADRGNLPS